MKEEERKKERKASNIKRIFEIINIVNDIIYTHIEFAQILCNKLINLEMISFRGIKINLYLFHYLAH